MAYIVTSSMTRPNTDCLFHLIPDPMVPDEIKRHWMNTYQGSAKCMGVDLTESADQLQLTITIFWDSAASYEEFKADPVLISGLFNVRADYWATNGITYEVISEETFTE